MTDEKALNIDYTQVCPICNSILDSNGYCTNEGCPMSGKNPSSELFGEE